MKGDQEEQAGDAEPRKGKQSKLPGFTEVEDDEVEALAERYRDQTDGWLEAQKTALETEKQLFKAFSANKALLKAARAHPKGKVKCGDFVLTLTVKDPSEKIKVKSLSKDEVED